jgi:hypothetical protein
LTIQAELQLQPGFVRTLTIGIRELLQADQPTGTTVVFYQEYGHYFVSGFVGEATQSRRILLICDVTRLSRA